MKTKFKNTLLVIAGFLCCICMLMGISFSQSTTARAAENTSNVEEHFEMKGGAGVRLSEQGGLRFIVEMDETIKSKVFNDDRYKLYVIIAPRVYFDGVDNGDYYSLYEQDKCILVDINDVNKVYESDGYWCANGCVYNVLLANVKLNFTGVACIYDTQSNSVYKYADFNITDITRNIYEVANEAALDYEEKYMASILDVYSWYGSEAHPIKVSTSEQYTALQNYATTDNIDFSDKWIVIEYGVETSPEANETIGGTIKTEYTVTFNANGGSAVASQEVVEGKCAVIPQEPTRALYTFEGWYYNDTLYDFSTPITQNITLNAKWSIESGDFTSSSNTYYYKQISATEHESGYGDVEYDYEVASKTAVIYASHAISVTGGSMSVNFSFNYSTIQYWIDNGYEGITFQVYVAGPTGSTIVADSFNGQQTTTLQVGAWNTIQISLQTLIAAEDGYMFKFTNYDANTFEIAIADVEPVEGCQITFVTVDGTTFAKQYVLKGEIPTMPTMNEVGYDYTWTYNGANYDFIAPATEDMVLVGTKGLKAIRVVGGTFEDYKSGGGENNGSGTLTYGAEVGGQTAYIYGERAVNQTAGVLSCQYQLNITVEDVEKWIADGYKQLKLQILVVAPATTVKISRLNGAEAAAEDYFTNLWHTKYINLTDLLTYLQSATGTSYLFRIWRPASTGTYGIALRGFEVTKDIQVALKANSAMSTAFEYGATIGGETAYISKTINKTSYGNVGSAIYFDITDDEIQSLMDAGYQYLSTEIYSNRTKVELYSDGVLTETVQLTANTWTPILLKLEKIKGWGTTANFVKVMWENAGEYLFAMKELTALKNCTVTFKDTEGNTLHEEIVLLGNTVNEYVSADGYVTKGWLLNGVEYDFNTPVQDDIVLTPNGGWKPVVKIASTETGVNFYSYISGNSSSGEISYNTVVAGKDVYVDCTNTIKATGGVLSCQWAYDTTAAQVDTWLADGYVAIKTMLYITAPEGVATVKVGWLNSAETTASTYPVNTWIPFYLDLEGFETNVLGTSNAFLFRIWRPSVVGTYGVAMTDIEGCKADDVASGMSLIKNNSTNFKYNGAVQTVEYNTEYQGKLCDVVYSYTGENNKAMLIPLVPNVTEEALVALQTAGYTTVEVDYYIETNQLLADGAMLQGDASYSLNLVRGAWQTLTFDIQKLIDQYSASQMITVHSYKIYAPGTVAFANFRVVSENAVATTYTVRYQTTDGEILGQETVLKGQTANQPNVEQTKAGYELVWNLNGKVYDFAQAVNEDIVLVATWEIKAISVNNSSTISTWTSALGTVYGNYAFNVEVGGKTAEIKATMNFDASTYCAAMANWKFNITTDDIDAWIAEGYKYVRTEVYFESTAASIPVGTWGYKALSTNNTYPTNKWITVYIDIETFKNNFNGNTIFKKNSTGYTSFSIATTEFVLCKESAVELLPNSNFVGTSDASFEYGKEIAGEYAYVAGSATVTAGNTAVANFRLALSASDIQSKMDAGYTHLNARVYISAPNQIVQMSLLGDNTNVKYYATGEWIEVLLNLEDLKNIAGTDAYLFRICAETDGEYSLAVAGFEYVIENIVENGNSLYQIYIPSDADDTLKTAANELQYFIEDATGVTLPIVQLYMYDDSVKYFSLGQTTLATINGVEAANNLGDSGFSIRTIDGNIYINALSGKGVLNGVYYYLEEALEYDFFITDTYSIETVDNLGLQFLNVDFIPDIEYAISGFGFTRGYASSDIISKNRLGVYNFEDIFAGNAFHNAFTYLPKDTYLFKNPYWYSDSETQLCYTARGFTSSYNSLKKEVAQKLYEALMASPDRYHVAFNMMDTDEGDICTCWKCTANKNTYGAYSANIILFLNDVAPLVEEKLQNANDPRANSFKITFMAYHDYCDAPNNSEAMKLNAHVIPMVCTSELDLLKGINHADNATHKANILDWRALANEVYFYGYDIQYQDGGYMIPYTSYNAYADFYQFAKANNIGFVYFESQAVNEYATGFNMVKAYLQAELARNADANVDTLIDKYFQGMYGSQSSAMKSVFTTVDAFMVTLADNGVVGGRTTQKTGFFDNAAYWPLAQLQNLYDNLDAIEAALIANGETQAAKNVRLEKIFPLYVMIRLYSANFASATLAEYKAEMSQLLDEFGITQIHQGYTVAQYKADVLS